MDIKIFAPALNTLEFSREDLIPLYNTVFQGDNSYINTIPDNQIKVNYFQPVAYKDRITLQFRTNSNGDNPPVIKAYRATGQLPETSIAEVAFTSSYILDADVDDNITTYQFSFRAMDLDGIGEGLYYFRVFFEYAIDELTTDTIVTMVSEPCFIKRVHKKTLYIEYNHPVNEFDIVFEQLFPHLAYRVYGRHEYKDQASVDTGYRNQSQAWNQTYSVPYSTDEYSFGNNKGLPDYVYNKLNHIFSLQYRTIDGKKYLKDDGSKWEFKRVELYSKSGAKLRVAESENKHGYALTQSIITVLTSPGTYPYATSPIIISDGYRTIFLAPQQVIESSLAENAFMSGLVADPGAFDLTGTFTITSGVLKYINGPGETFTPYATEVFPKVVEMALSTDSDNQNYNYRYTDGQHIMDYGDGVVVAVSGLAFPGIQRDVSHLYAVSGSYTARLFHQDTMTGWVPSYTGTGGALVANFIGDVSAALQDFTCSYAALTTLDTTFMGSCANVLASFTVSNCGATGLSDNMFADFGAWGNLINIDISHNSLDVAALNVFIPAFTANSTIANGGFLSCKFQSPPAPPDSGLQAILDDLTNTYDWITEND